MTEQDLQSLKSDLRRLADTMPSGGLTREEALIRKALIVEAVKAEREACAQIAEQGGVGVDPYCCADVADGIAAAIRARGQ